ncbi:sensor histidine kinase [Actinoallomurus sp. CA-150999]|uniref:sensor histidine kinase n=1 Tax=Actinoallomurus sp. CA-150999 TaxID=3239887 RepID=UPI003D911210
MSRRQKDPITALIAGRPGPLIYTLLLVIVSGAAMDVLGGKVRPALVAAAGLIGFVGLYVVCFWCVFRSQARRGLAAAALVALGLLTVALAYGFGGRMVELFMPLSIACGAVMFRCGLRQLPAALGGVSACAGLCAFTRGDAGDDAFTIGYATLISGVVIYAMLRMLAVINELRDAREELAHAAVMRERLRFSRDLHDLLGHTLSLIVVKAEAVRMFITRQPDIAERHATDIEEVGRGALEEVRDAVAGYRANRLADEVDGARSALADAGVEVVVHTCGEPMPQAADEVLSWVVREGVTNVIRHSKATSCEIEIRYVDGLASAQISDDGVGPDPGSPAGYGLRGLAERLAAAGGGVETSARRGGGFCLTASMPVEGVGFGGERALDSRAARRGSADDAGRTRAAPRS